MNEIRKQFTNNLLPFLSVAVAVTALLYSTWRNETTEQQRSLRQAGFAVLERMTDLEGHIFIIAYSDREDVAADQPFLAWAAAREIRDLSAALPAPIPDEAQAFFRDWSNRSSALGARDPNDPTSQQAARHAADELSDNIQSLRELIVATMAKFT